MTDEGRKAHAEMTDPGVFYRRGVKLYNEWRATQPMQSPRRPQPTLMHQTYRKATAQPRGCFWVTKVDGRFVKPGHHLSYARNLALQSEAGDLQGLCLQGCSCPPCGDCCHKARLRNFPSLEGQA